MQLLCLRIPWNNWPQKWQNMVYQSRAINFKKLSFQNLILECIWHFWTSYQKYPYSCLFVFEPWTWFCKRISNHSTLLNVLKRFKTVLERILFERDRNVNYSWPFLSVWRQKQPWNCKLSGTLKHVKWSEKFMLYMTNGPKNSFFLGLNVNVFHYSF